MLRDAIFILNKEDVKAVSQVLDLRGKSFQDVLHENPKWIFKRVRRIVPPPVQLYFAVKEVYDHCADVLDAKTSKPLFDSAAKLQANQNLKLIKEGWVSDPPDVQLYFDIGVDEQGLRIYRCVRGTNSVEGDFKY